MSIRLGRPPKGTESLTLRRITFCVDPETLAALEALEADLDLPKVRGRRSLLLRKLILDAHQRLKLEYSH